MEKAAMRRLAIGTFRLPDNNWRVMNKNVTFTEAILFLILLFVLLMLVRRILPKIDIPHKQARVMATQADLVIPF